MCFLFFFFSSRRRHTRFDCDWSSDVCSSDLLVERRRYPELLQQAELGPEPGEPDDRVQLAQRPERRRQRGRGAPEQRRQRRRGDVGEREPCRVRCAPHVCGPGPGEGGVVDRDEAIDRQDAGLQIHRASRYHRAVSATPRATGYWGAKPSSVIARVGSQTQRSCASSRRRSRLRIAAACPSRAQPSAATATAQARGTGTLRSSGWRWSARPTARANSRQVTGSGYATQYVRWIACSESAAASSTRTRSATWTRLTSRSHEPTVSATPRRTSRKSLSTPRSRGPYTDVGRMIVAGTRSANACAVASASSFECP